MGALWRSVEAAEAAQGARRDSTVGQWVRVRGVGRGGVAGTARRVADTLAEHAPSADEPWRRRQLADDPGQLAFVDVQLTAGLAWAFVEQTVEAVTVRAPKLVAVVEEENEKALQALSSLLDPENERRTLRAAWAEAMVAFVDGVNRRAGDEARTVWTALQDWLQGAPTGGGVLSAAAVLSASAATGAGGAPSAGLGGVGSLSGPEGWDARRLSWQAERSKEMESGFPWLVALSALPWPTRSGEAEAERVAVARQRWGRTVVGALWSSVSWSSALRMTGFERRDRREWEQRFGVREWEQRFGVGEEWRRAAQDARWAAAGVSGPPPVVAQPSLRGVDVPLTAGLALAFVDQTLAAVTDAGAPPEVVAVVEQERRRALRDLSSLRNPRNGRGMVREAWAEVMVDFVDGVTRSGGVRRGGSAGLGVGCPGRRWHVGCGGVAGCWVWWCGSVVRSGGSGWSWSSGAAGPAGRAGPGVG